MSKPLEFIYNLIVYRQVKLKRSRFLSTDHKYHPVGPEPVANIFFIDKVEVNEATEVITVYRNSQRYIDIHSRPYWDYYGYEEIETINFEDYLCNKVDNEFREYLDKIDALYWDKPENDFDDYAKKNLKEILYLEDLTAKYIGDIEEDEFVESSINVLSLIQELLKRSREDIERRIHSKTEITKTRESFISETRIEEPNKNNGKNQWLKLIADAKIEELFNQLLDSEAINEKKYIITLHLSRWNNLKQDMSKGILDRDKYTIELNNINNSLIEFVKNLE